MKEPNEPYTTLHNVPANNAVPNPSPPHNCEHVLRVLFVVLQLPRYVVYEKGFSSSGTW